MLEFFLLDATVSNSYTFVLTSHHVFFSLRNQHSIINHFSLLSIFRNFRNNLIFSFPNFLVLIKQSQVLSLFFHFRGLWLSGDHQLLFLCYFSLCISFTVIFLSSSFTFIDNLTDGTDNLPTVVLELISNSLL